MRDLFEVQERSGNFVLVRVVQGSPSRPLSATFVPQEKDLAFYTAAMLNGNHREAGDLMERALALDPPTRSDDF